mgnify:FL=1
MGRTKASTRTFEFNAPGTRVDDRDPIYLALLTRLFVDVPADDKPGALFADPRTHRMAAHVLAIGQGITMDITEKRNFNVFQALLV